MIYLDNAATSFPKPDTVLEAMTRTMGKYGANPGRSGHRLALSAGRIVWQARERLCELFNAQDPAAFVFTHNCTSALNLAIKGALHPGDHVVTTALEHNSVLRPLHTLEQEGRITLSVLSPLPDTFAVTAQQVQAALRPDTRLVVMSHASNVTGAVQPVENVARLCHAHNVLFLVDTAQTAGLHPIDLTATLIDLMAFPGHKALYGPQGTGGLYVRPGLEANILPLIEGGTGSDSHSVLQPADMPDRYESGTLNTPGIAGLSAGIRFVRQNTDAIRQLEQELTYALWYGLQNLPGIALYGPPPDIHPRVDVISFNLGSADSGLVADQLDQMQIAVRAGLHCAPFMHRHLGSFTQGTVRMSVGFFNTKAAVREALRAVETVAGMNM